MTKINKKLFSIVLCFLVAISTFAMFGATNSGNGNTPVYAQTIEVTTNDDYWLVPGARVRFAGDGVTGISYRFQVKKSVYEKNEQDYADVKYGILIAPNDGFDLSFDNVFGENSIYNWAVQDKSGKWTYTPEDGKKQIVNLEAIILKEDVATVNGVDTEVMYFNGNLVSIKEANFTRNYQAKGYVAYKAHGSDEYVYQPNIVGNEENVRSIINVALKAVDDASSDAATEEQKQLLRDTYVTETITNTSVKYYTQHLIETPNGYVQYGELVEGTGTIGATVNASAPLTINGYQFSLPLSSSYMTGTALANDQLILYKYYTAKEYTITFNGGILADDPEVVGMPAASATVKHGFTLTNITPSRPGYLFLGWKKANGSMILGDIVGSENLTLTAVWIKNQFDPIWGEWTPIS